MSKNILQIINASLKENQCVTFDTLVLLCSEYTSANVNITNHLNMLHRLNYVNFDKLKKTATLLQPIPDDLTSSKLRYLYLRA